MDNRFKFISAAVASLVMGGSGAYLITDQFLDEVEGPSSTRVYQDGANVWTNCRGNTHGVDRNTRVSQAECDAIDRENLTHFLGVVDRHVTMSISDATHAALASFAYNVGEVAFARSTLVRKMNQGDLPGACAELSRWTYVGGRDCRLTRGQRNGCFGIVERRNMERELCEQTK